MGTELYQMTPKIHNFIDKILFQDLSLEAALQHICNFKITYSQNFKF